MRKTWTGTMIERISTSPLLIFFSLALVNLANAEPPKEMSCEAAMGHMMQRQMEGISYCANTMEFKDGNDRAKKLACIFRCILIKEKIIPETGKPTREYLDDFVEKEVPKNLLEKAEPIINQCFDVLIKNLDENESDEYCESYKPVIKCLLSFIPTFCDSLD